jgi:hypothetical protein
MTSRIKAGGKETYNKLSHLYTKLVRWRGTHDEKKSVVKEVVKEDKG